MGNHIPFARSDTGVLDAKDIIEWLRVDELLEKTKKLSPDDEFMILIGFLIEFAGGYEMAEHRMYEMCVEQAALSYKAYAEAVRRIKNRVVDLYVRKESGRRMDGICFNERTGVG